jgi:hypothetical protein
MTSSWDHLMKCSVYLICHGSASFIILGSFRDVFQVSNVDFYVGHDEYIIVVFLKSNQQL